MGINLLVSPPSLTPSHRCSLPRWWLVVGVFYYRLGQEICYEGIHITKLGDDWGLCIAWVSVSVWGIIVAVTKEELDQ